MRFLPFLLLLSCTASRQVSSADQFQARALTYRYTNTIEVGDVEEGPMIDAASRFFDMAASGEKVITLRIDSWGGSVFLGNRWIKLLEDVKKQNGIGVTCIVDGAAYSMGAVILESGLCDLRLATTRSTILFHNCSGQASGTAEDIRQTAEFMDRLNTSMAMTVSARLLMTLDEYRAKIAHADWVLAVPEALTWRVIDGVAWPDEIEPPKG